jgi:hypothetical protein
MVDERNNLGKIVGANSPAEHLEDIVKDVEYLDNGKVKIEGSKTSDGSQIYLIVKENDIPDTVGDIINAHKSAEDVFDKYVIERIIQD